MPEHNYAPASTAAILIFHYLLMVLFQGNGSDFGPAALALGRFFFDREVSFARTTVGHLPIALLALSTATQHAYLL